MPRRLLVLLIGCVGICGCASDAIRPAGESADVRLARCIDTWVATEDLPDDGGAARLPHTRGWRGAALDALRRGLAELSFDQPWHAPTLVAAASASMLASDSASAERWLDDALALDPVYEPALLARVSLLVASGNLRRARALVGRWITTRPDSVAARETLAGIEYLDDAFDDARSSLAAADALAVRKRELHAGSAAGTPRELLSTEDVASAARRAYLRGLIEEGAGQVDEAERAYAAALEADPMSPAAARLEGLRALR